MKQHRGSLAAAEMQRVGGDGWEGGSAVLHGVDWAKAFHLSLVPPQITSMKLNIFFA